MDDLEMHRALFGSRNFNPEDTVACPFDPQHVMKRKTLPHHVANCRKTCGMGFHRCQYSRIHWFKNKEERDQHEFVCHEKRQHEQVERALAYDEEPVEVHPLTKAIIQHKGEEVKLRNSKSSQMVNVEAAHENFVDPTMSDATRNELPFWDQLTKEVLYSTNRIKPIRFQESANIRMDAVEEEGDEDLAQYETAARAMPVGRRRHKFDMELDHGYANWDADIPNGTVKEINRFGYPELSFRLCMYGKSRPEDDRDAQDDPTGFSPDVNAYPRTFRVALKKKFERDAKWYRTRMNPRYDKSLDNPGANLSRAPDPRKFEEFAAYYEDLVVKPSSETSGTVEQNPAG